MIFKGFALNYNYVQIVFGYYFDDIVGGATIWTNFNYTYPSTIWLQYLKILFSSFGEEDFQIVFSYYFTNNVGGATIWTKFDYKYTRTICMQYLRIFFSSFGEEDFQRFAFKLTMFKLSLAIISPIM